MKRIAIQTALTICVFFTVAMIVCLVMGYIFAGPSYGLNLTASLLIATVSIGMLQAFWFTEAVLKKPAYLVRMIGFDACALPALAACAWIGAWFPPDIPLAWVEFVVIFFIISALSTIGYNAYFRRTAGSYEQALARYRKQQSTQADTRTADSERKR